MSKEGQPHCFTWVNAMRSAEVACGHRISSEEEQPNTGKEVQSQLVHRR
jgi:hypothetical protein